MRRATEVGRGLKKQIGLGTRLALSRLLAKELVVQDWRRNGNYDSEPRCIFQNSEAGERWMLENQQRFDILSKTGRKSAKISPVDAGISNDEIPF